MTTATKTRRPRSSKTNKGVRIGVNAAVAEAEAIAKPKPKKIDCEAIAAAIKHGGLMTQLKAIADCELRIIKAAKESAGTYWDLGKLFADNGYTKLRKKHKMEFWAALGSDFDTDTPNRRRCERAIRINTVHETREAVGNLTVGKALLYGSRVKIDTSGVRQLNQTITERSIELREAKEKAKLDEPTKTATIEDAIENAVDALLQAATAYRNQEEHDLEAKYGRALWASEKNAIDASLKGKRSMEVALKVAKGTIMAAAIAAVKNGKVAEALGCEDEDE